MSKHNVKVELNTLNTEKELENSLIISEYESLRDEILSRLSKISRLQEGLLLGTLIYVATIFQKGSQGSNGTQDPTTSLFYGFLLMLPFIAFSIELVCTSEQDAVFRAGIYIRDNIEKQYRLSIFRGWEDWLERQDKVRRRRTSDKFMKYARRFVIMLYCAISSIVGATWLKQYLPTSIASLDQKWLISIAFAGYSILFMLMISIIQIFQKAEFSSPVYNVFVIDIDGCLMDDQRTISEENIKALTFLKKQGVRVILSTGRSMLSLNKVCTDTGLDGLHVSCQGACIYDTAEKEPKETMLHFLQLKELHEIIGEINKYRFQWVAFGVSNCYCDEKDKTEILEKLSKRKDIPEKADDILIGIVSPLTYQWDKIGKILCYVNFNDKQKENWLKKPLSKKYKIIRSTEDTLEILNKKASKKTAVIKIIKEEYKISDVVSLVLGDYDNDIDILKWGTHSLAPRNASTNVTKVKGVDTLDFSNNDNLIEEIAKSYFKYKRTAQSSSGIDQESEKENIGKVLGK